MLKQTNDNSNSEKEIIIKECLLSNERLTELNINNNTLKIKLGEKEIINEKITNEYNKLKIYESDLNHKINDLEEQCLLYSSDINLLNNKLLDLNENIINLKDQLEIYNSKINMQNNEIKINYKDIDNLKLDIETQIKLKINIMDELKKEKNIQTNKLKYVENS